MRLLLVLVILGIVLLPSIAYASEQQVVVITANPGGNITCITNFAINVVSPYEIQMSWTPVSGGNATGVTLIKGAYGRWPADPSDGFVVYEGLGNTTTHWVNTEFIGVDVYYCAWAETSSGYTACYSSGSITGGEDVAAIATNLGLFTFITFALVGTIATYTIKRTVLAFITAGAWLVLAIYCLGASTGTNPTQIVDIYMGLFWLGIAMVLVSAFEPLVMSQREEAEVISREAISEYDLLNDEIKEMYREAGMQPRARHKPRRERRLSEV